MLPFWDDLRSVRGFCTANGTNEEQTGFVCEENG
jgi:hypothetical protein